MATDSPTVFSDDVKARFWAKVDVRGPDECWPWLGATLSKGQRGIFWLGRNYTAPRFMLMLATGETPNSKTFACHTCDNPNCVNPSHLWWGDVKQNSVDAARKGRVRGQSITHCKRGHELSGYNAGPNNGGFGRKCRTCQRMHDKAYRDKKSARAALAGGSNNG